MKVLKNIITIIAEILILIVGLIWYLRTKDEEPVIVIISSSTFLMASILTKLYDKSEKIRPKVVFHRKDNFNMRGPMGYTANNPKVIRVGIDNTEQYWDLEWSYIIEVRNNSSVTAYNYQVEYMNKPKNTVLKGEIGKIQPIHPNDKFEFTLKLNQDIVGTHIDADKYLNENADKLLKDMKIISRYSDEFGESYTTEYNWLTDHNEFK